MSSPIYNAGIYCRLSKEDRKSMITNTSESIDNQKMIIENYLMQHPEIKKVEVYIDDGFTGLNYDRAAFQKMMDDMVTGRINTVITKDQSRFGREQIETLKLITMEFKERRIRYIAVNDGIDTLLNADETIISLKAFINDYYSADGSRKVKASQKMKQVSGAFIGSHAPYGFLKDPKNKNHLIIDPQTAPIVQRIFTMWIGGIGQSTITRILSDEGIENPTRYKQDVLGIKYRNDMKLESTNYWTYATIHRMLQHRVYTGDMVQHRTEKISYKMKKKRTIPKEEWIIVENTHEAIIPREQFQIAQDLFIGKSRQLKLDENMTIYAGLFFCGDCGRRMSKFRRRSKDVPRFKCATYSNYGKHRCTNHSIREDELESILLEQIRKNAIEALKENDYGTIKKKTLRKRQDQNVSLLDKLINDNMKFSSKHERMLTNLAEDIITREDFVIFTAKNKADQEELKGKIQLLNEKITNKNADLNQYKAWVDHFIQYKDIEELNREILVNLVQRIEIFEDRHIEITFRFQNPFEILY